MGWNKALMYVLSVAGVALIASSGCGSESDEGAPSCAKACERIESACPGTVQSTCISECKDTQLDAAADGCSGAYDLVEDCCSSPFRSSSGPPPCIGFNNTCSGVCADEWDALTQCRHGSSGGNGGSGNGGSGNGGSGNGGSGNGGSSGDGGTGTGNGGSSGDGGTGNGGSSGDGGTGNGGSSNGGSGNGGSGASSTQDCEGAGPKTFTAAGLPCGRPPQSPAACTLTNGGWNYGCDRATCTWKLGSECRCCCPGEPCTDACPKEGGSCGACNLCPE